MSARCRSTADRRSRSGGPAQVEPESEQEKHQDHRHGNALEAPPCAPALRDRAAMINYHSSPARPSRRGGPTSEPSAEARRLVNRQGRCYAFHREILRPRQTAPLPPKTPRGRSPIRAVLSPPLPFSGLYRRRPTSGTRVSSVLIANGR